MKTRELVLTGLTLLAIGALLVGCKTTSQSPDVADSIQKSIHDAGLKDVTVTQDRSKGIVTLGGQVVADNEKSQAEAMAKSLADGQVVADQIAVVPPGAAQETMAMNSDLDQGIEKNLDADLIKNRMHENVSYAVKNGVVTLTGEVSSEYRRTGAETVATGVPNVQQVVNDMQVVKSRKASSAQ
jgi:hyperosmotically inducible protein